MSRNCIEDEFYLVMAKAYGKIWYHAETNQGDNLIDAL